MNQSKIRYARSFGARDCTVLLKLLAGGERRHPGGITNLFASLYVSRRVTIRKVHMNFAELRSNGTCTGFWTNLGVWDITVS